MRYYKVTVLLEVPDEEVATWGSSCDETFHGPGVLHDPDFGRHVIDHDLVDEKFFKENKNNIFTPEGGI